MAYKLNLKTETYQTGAADDPIAQFRGVVLDSTGAIEYPAARTDLDVVGVTQDNNGLVAGDDVQVGPALWGGVTKIEAGEAIAIGEFITFGADGRALDADTTGDIKWGIAREAASAAGELISVKFGYYGVTL